MLSVDLYFIKYYSTDQLYLNGLPIFSRQVYTFAKGGSVKSRQGHQDKRKLIGPLVGVTYGMAKGGDAVQQEYQMERDFQDRRMRAMPKAMDALMDGKEDKAAEILASTGMTNREVNKALARMADPGLRDTAALRRIAERHATEEERARLDRTLH